MCHNIVAFSLALMATVMLASSKAGAAGPSSGNVPFTFNYQAMITDGSGTPLANANNLTFEFQIWDPGKTCLLYDESQSGSQTDTDNAALVSLNVGSVTTDPKRTGNDPGYDMATIFANSGTFATGTNCPSGYTPAAGDSRVLRVIVTQGAGSPVTLSPDVNLGSVPQAYVAETLQGKTPSQFIQTNTSTTQANVDALTATNNDISGLNLHNHDAHNDTRYVKIGVPFSGSVNTTGNIDTTGTVGIGTTAAATGVTLDVEGPTPTLRIGGTGNTGNTLSLDFYGNNGTQNTASIKSTDNANTLNFYTGGLPAMSIGSAQQVNFASSVTAGGSFQTQGTLTFGNYTNSQESTLVPTLIAGGFSGTIWKNSSTSELRYFDGSSAQTVVTTGTNLSGDVTGPLATTVVSTVGGSTAANIHAAEVLANAATNINTAGAIVKRDAAGNFVAGTISANLTGNVTGNVTGASSLNVLKTGDTMTGALTMQGATAINVGTWITSTRPTTPTAGTTGFNTFTHYLETFNGTSWIDDAADPTTTVTNVSAAAPLTSSGGTTPTISMPQATAGQSGYLSSTDFSTFANKVNRAGDTMTGALNIAANTTSGILKVTQVGSGPAATFVGGSGVGIGTASPSFPLDVAGAGSTTARILSTGNLANLLLQSQGAGGRGWYFTTGNTASGLNGTLRVYDQSAGAYRMTFDAAGDVGIGTTLPGAMLDVGTPGSALGTMRLEGSSSGSVQIQPPTAGTSWTMTLPSTPGSNGQFLQTDGLGNTSWAPASGSGTVNLGTTNELAYYIGSGTAVSGLATANNSVLLTNATGTPGWVATSNDSFSQYANLGGRSGGQNLTGGTGTGENLTLDSTSNATKGTIVLAPTGGNVAINTTTAPNSSLAIGGDWNNGFDRGINIATLTSGGSGDVGYTAGRDVNNNVNLWWEDSTSISRLTTSLLATPLRIDASSLSLQAESHQNVGIGTTAPNAVLHVYSSNTGTPTSVIQAANGQIGDLTDWENNMGTVLAYVDKNGKFHGDGSGLTNIAGGSGITGLTPGGLTYAATATTIATDSSNFHLDALNHRFGIGTTSPSALFDVLGNASGAPNAVIQAAGGQSADLMDWVDSGGAVATQIDSSGLLYLNAIASTMTGAVNKSYVASVTGSMVSSVTVTAPIVNSGSSTAVALSIPNATGTQDGYLTKTDWNNFNSKQNALGYTPVSKNGDSMTGTLTINSSSTTGLSITPPTSSDSLDIGTQFVVNNFGDVGIGTASPSFLLDVRGPAPAQVLNVVNTNTGGTATGISAMAIAGSSGTGILAQGTLYGVEGQGSGSGDGVYGETSGSGNGVKALSTGTGYGLYAASQSGTAAFFTSTGSGDAVSTVVIQPGSLQTGALLEVQGSPSNTYIDNTGYVSIGSVAHPTSLLELGAGTSTTPPMVFDTGALLSTPKAGAVEYDGNDLYVTDSSGRRHAIAGIYVGTTTSFGLMNGAQVGSSYLGKTGYAAATARCNNDISGSHMCTGDEMVRSAVLGITMPSGGAWYSTGGSYATAYADCKGWTSGSGSDSGYGWDQSGNNGGVAYLCNTTGAIACCK